MVLISDAPSESEALCRSTQGKVFNSFPDNDARNVSTRSHLQIAEKVSPVPIRVYMSQVDFKEVKWAQTQDYIVLTQKTGTNMHK
jgi:hypothetical protein